ncbi:metallophosphoesterase [Roseomonas sp. GC11]|uniref:metallophosphoesterase family protein n=1 Tax=Roseomonas sp. GC11 TaxID=2950546 RepID=UPI00210DE40F|nr:metallophosphoesterase [Roseomonas sp. GC11]MCQ4160482.1 metallophosphoesterase [Roseomonas sp. GC11]
MAFTLAQISDTHLSALHPGFSANFEALAEHLLAEAPDLVIHTGDVSAHGEQPGPQGGEDLAFARAAMDGLGLDWLAVPGNHDVGNDPACGGDTPADATRMARWEAAFGPGYFLRDVPGWRLIGLNTLITGTGLPQAEAQFAFLEEALAGAAGRRIGLFQHKPLCEVTMAESQLTYWAVLPGARRRLLGLLAGHDVAFIASGHVHQAQDRGVVEGFRHVWAPAVAFFVGDTWQARMGDKRLGYVRHRLHADGRHEAEILPLPGLQPHDIGLMPHIYGPQKPVAA